MARRNAEKLPTKAADPIAPLPKKEQEHFRQEFAQRLERLRKKGRGHLLPQKALDVLNGIVEEVVSSDLVEGDKEQAHRADTAKERQQKLLDKRKGHAITGPVNIARGE